MPKASGLKAVILNRAGSGNATSLVTNQSGTSGTAAVGSSNFTAKQAMSFQLPGPGAIRDLQLNIAQQNGVPPDSLTVRIETDNAGAPSGTAIGSITTLASAYTSTATWYSFLGTFVGVPLQANTTYWIVLQRTGTVDLTCLAASQAAVNGDGQAKSFNSGSSTWSDVTNDIAFQLTYDVGLRAGLFGSGASESIYTKSGAGIAGLPRVWQWEQGAGIVGAAASGARVGGGTGGIVKSGYAAAGLVGAGPSASTTAETGYAAVGAVGAGSGASVFVESGYARAGGAAAGTRAVEHSRSGYAVAGAVGAGSRAEDHSRSGYATVGGLGAGTSASVAVETGFATVGGVGAGALLATRVYTKAGYATVGGVGAGPRGASYNRAGFATVSGVGAGGRIREYAKTGHSGGAEKLSLGLVPSGTFVGVGDATAHTSLAQSFQVARGVSGGTFRLVTVRWWVKKTGTLPDSQRFGMQSDSSGSPAGDNLGTTSFGDSFFSTTPGWFTSTPNLNPLSLRTLYWLVLSRAGAINGTNFLSLQEADTYDYPDGSAKQYDGSTWTARTPDFAIEVTVVYARVAAFGTSESLTQETGFGRTGTVGSGSRVREIAKSGYATAGGVGAGPSESAFVESGYATVGGVGAGSKQFVSGAGTVYTKAGYATAGLVGAGARASIYVESGAGVAGTVAAGTRARERNRSGFAVVAAVAAGSRAMVRGRSGYAVSGGLIGSGADVDILNRRGYGVAGLAAYGFEIKGGGAVKTGFGAAGLTAAGADADLLGKSGFALVGLVAAGTRTRQLARTGLAVVAGAAAGARAMLRARSGFAAVGTTAAGSRSSVFVESGRGTAGTVGAGGETTGRVATTKSGYAIAGLSASGSSASIYARAGVGIAGLVAAGARRVVYTETGWALLEGTGTGVRAIDHGGKTGWAAVGADGSGHWSTPSRTPGPPGSFSFTDVGRFDRPLIRIKTGSRGVIDRPDRGHIDAPVGAGVD